MRDWNVVVTVRDRGFTLACEMLSEYGRVQKTEYFNVLALYVDDPQALMESLREEFSGSFPPDFLAKVVPVTVAFDFQTSQEFEAKAIDAISRWRKDLRGKRFHVRMHRRGFKGRLSTMEEERFLGGILLEAIEKESAPGHISYEDPDAIIVVETLGQRAGMSMWNREQLTRYPFLRLN